MKIGDTYESNGHHGVEIEDAILTATQPQVAHLEMPLNRKLAVWFWRCAIVLILLLVGRTFYLSVIRHEYYRGVAEGNKIRSIVIKAPRGKIYDRSGEALVANVPSLNAVIIPADLPKDSQEREDMAQKIASILNMNEGEVWGMMENSDLKSLNPLPLKQNISQVESLLMAEKINLFPGIAIEKTAVRNYLYSSILSHVLGYEGKIEKSELEENSDYLLTDYIGKQGLEKSYEPFLRGTHGAVQVEVDSRGNPRKELDTINPKSGSDLYLNIDLGLQKKLSDSLNAMLEKTGTKTAAAVAVNPRNGGILAMVSLPAYDNNSFAQGISAADYQRIISDPDKPLFDRAVSGEYPPGSTLKPLVAAAALSEGTINESTSLFDSGKISIGSYHFRDWKAHGAVDIKKAIAESCDVFFYAVGGGWSSIQGLGMDRMKKYENMFGLGKETGIDIPGEETGLIPDEQWKLQKLNDKWYTGDSYHAAIGQGFVTSTPLQLANYIAAIANGGTLYQPRIVSQIKKNDGEIIKNAPKILNDNFMDPSVIRIVQEGMRQTVTEGTAQTLNDLSVAVAGKTGTAQFGSENKTHAWFVSFAPFDNPEIAMAVLMEGGGEGHSSAVPITKDVYQWYFNRK